MNQERNTVAVGGPDRIVALERIAAHSAFIRALLDQHDRGDLWSDVQVAALNQTLDKMRPRRRPVVRCSECGQILTEPSSIEAGIGPTCAAKLKRKERSNV